MICKLCLSEKKPKSNTHYLTDFIIRPALNEDGVGLRGKGLYWSIDTTKPTVDFKYQQHASSEKLENLLGRLTTDEENLDAKNNIDFSVNNSFCKECEDIFTTIENQFDNQLLSIFRNVDLTDIDKIILDDEQSKIFRLFFLMQFWRTSVCDNSFKLSDATSEYLRLKIRNIDTTNLECIPLSVTFLETLKDDNDEDTGEKYKTENVVAPLEDTKPYKILMNDFVIQLYEDLNFPFDSFYGYNNINDYVEFLNYEKNEFSVKIVHNAERKTISNVYFRIAAKKFMALRSWWFLDEYTNRFKRLPSNKEMADYLDAISKNKDIMKFTPEKINFFNKEYFKTLC